MTNQMSQETELLPFVDDINIYYESRSIDNLVRSVNTELKSVQKWFDANRLSLNKRKLIIKFFTLPTILFHLTF